MSGRGGAEWPAPAGSRINKVTAAATGPRDVLARLFLDILSWEKKLVTSKGENDFS